MAITRRTFLKGALTLAGSSLGGALAVPALKTLLPPPITHCDPEAAYDTLLYKRREPGTWYEPLKGKVARKEDFKLNQSAMVTWAPKELEEELGSCEVVLTLVKLPAEEWTWVSVFTSNTRVGGDVSDPGRGTTVRPGRLTSQACNSGLRRSLGASCSIYKSL